ncbi:PH domain-containing protein, partial [Cellulomonas citrea]|uniref:PH domain-containing protein n=1 Tax=Cellulomonas citrea TaxID=1909423 RepID=UPI00135891FE
MHPVTPLLRGWKVFAGVLVVVGYQASDNLRSAAKVLAGHGWLLVLGGLAAVAVIGFVYSAIAWRMTRFAVTDQAVHLRSGIVFRQQRQARLDRLQAVDVVRPLLAQLVGLSELRLEVAGGAGSAVSLAFLREHEAEELRAELLGLAAGLQRPATAPVAAGEPSAALDADAAPAEAPPAAPGAAAYETAPEYQVYEVPLGRLLASVALSGAVAWFLLLVVGLTVTGFATGDPGSVLLALPMVLGAVSVMWSRVNSGASFRAATSPDGIRLRHGLTEARAQTVPPGRVQAVSIHQGPLWRHSDWWRVQINVAGYAHEQSSGERETVLHPVATRQEARTALWLVLPDLGVADPVATLDAALTGTGTDGGFVVAPRRSAWVDPVGWRRHGVLVTDRALILRSGRFWRRVVVVPHERTQSLGLTQGPVQRALRVATFVLHSTPGPVLPRVEHLDQAVAAQLLHEQAGR